MEPDHPLARPQFAIRGPLLAKNGSQLWVVTFQEGLLEIYLVHSGQELIPLLLHLPKLLDLLGQSGILPVGFPGLFQSLKVIDFCGKKQALVHTDGAA